MVQQNKYSTQYDLHTDSASLTSQQIGCSTGDSTSVVMVFSAAPLIQDRGGVPTKSFSLSMCTLFGVASGVRCIFAVKAEGILTTKNGPSYCLTHFICRPRSFRGLKYKRVNTCSTNTLATASASLLWSEKSFGPFCVRIHTCQNSDMSSIAFQVWPC